MLGRHPRSPFLWPGARLGCWSRGALPASSPASRPHPTRGSFLAGAHLLRPRPQVLPCPALPTPLLGTSCCTGSPGCRGGRRVPDRQPGSHFCCPGVVSAAAAGQRPVGRSTFSFCLWRTFSFFKFFFFLKPELIYNVPSITLVQLYIHLPSFSFHTLLPLSRSNARGRALFRVLPSRTHHLLVFNVTSCIYQLQTPCQSLLSLPLESKGCSP